MTSESRAFLDDLANRLQAAATPKTRAWWERYLKGEAAFRGVKMAETRRVVDALWTEHRLERRSTADHLALARSCMRQPPTEDKLAGVLLLAEHVLADLRLEHVPTLARPLADGSLADWNSVDWYCVKVLGPFVTGGDDVEARSRAIAGWHTADGLWQRRAAAVAFVHHAAREGELFDGFHALLREVMAANAADATRWSQTSVGWLLRELSRHHAELVREFLAEHPELSTEAKSNARRYL